MTNQYNKGRDEATQAKALSPTSILPPIIKSEVNFLKLPFFALSRRDVSARSKTILRLATERNGHKVDTVWTVSANPDYGYPGPFDKKVYRAVEQIITEIGIPIKNPISFNLRDLCRRMKISESGRNRRRNIYHFNVAKFRNGR